jgi:hypothetical protein
MAAKFCGRCGTELPIAGLPACYDCMTQDEAVGSAKAFHQAALTVLRGFDRSQVIAAGVDAADAADAALKKAQDELPPLRVAVPQAVAAERKAQDRARAAAEYARKCAADEKKAQQGPPERATAALTAARDSDDVAKREKAALEGATTARVEAEKVLAAHHDKVAGLEAAALQARHVMDNPPEQVPMSAWTAITAHPLLVLGQGGMDELGDEAKGAVLAQIQGASIMSGLTDATRAEGHAEGVKEADETARKRPVLISPDGSPGSTQLISPIGTWRGGRH